jgi:hypothetical protein
MPYPGPERRRQARVAIQCPVTARIDAVVELQGETGNVSPGGAMATLPVVPAQTMLVTLHLPGSPPLARFAVVRWKRWDSGSARWQLGLSFGRDLPPGLVHDLPI